MTSSRMDPCKKTLTSRCRSWGYICSLHAHRFTLASSNRFIYTRTTSARRNRRVFSLAEKKWRFASQPQIVLAFVFIFVLSCFHESVIVISAAASFSSSTTTTAPSHHLRHTRKSNNNNNNDLKHHQHQRPRHCDGHEFFNKKCHLCKTFGPIYRTISEKEDLADTPERRIQRYTDFIAKCKQCCEPDALPDAGDALGATTAAAATTAATISTTAAATTTTALNSPPQPQQQGKAVEGVPLEKEKDDDYVPKSSEAAGVELS